MNFRVKRRQFGQLAIFSAATSLLANLASKVFAQQSEQLYGVLLAPASKDITVDLVDAAAANTTPAIVIQSIDLAALATAPVSLVTDILASTVNNPQEPTLTVNKALVVKKPSERITSFTVLSDNTLVIAATAETKKGSFSRLLFTKPSQVIKKKPDKGLKIKKTQDKKYSTVESFVATTIQGKKGDQLLSVVSLAEGVPPFELALIDPNSGQVNYSVQLGLPELPANQRLSNLAQSPDRTIYATNSGSEGILLVQLDLANKSQITGRGNIIGLVVLSLNNKPLENDLASLAFSSSGQLFALADPNYEGTNSLFVVDVKTGAMTLLRKLAVDKIAFARA